MEPKIIFQDEFLLAIDKPAGWIVNEAQTTGGNPVVQSWIAEKFEFPTARNRELRSGIVHRIDKETSGILLTAKTPEAFSSLQAQFKKRVIEKEYTALVHGDVKIDKGSIEVPLGRLPWNRERFGVLPGGRPAVTFYEVISRLKYSKENKYSLIKFYPKTGRTHQIRVHAKYMGHPLVSDDFYAGRKTSRRDRVWCPRLFLHASGITFSHPVKNEKVKLTSGLAHDLARALDSLAKQG